MTDGTREYNAAQLPRSRPSTTWPSRRCCGSRSPRAQELAPHGCTAVALTPGWMRSEMMLENYGVTEDNWREATVGNPHFAAISETPALRRAARSPRWPPTRDVARAATAARSPPAASRASTASPTSTARSPTAGATWSRSRTRACRPTRPATAEAPAGVTPHCGRGRTRRGHPPHPSDTQSRRRRWCRAMHFHPTSRPRPGRRCSPAPSAASPAPRPRAPAHHDRPLARLRRRLPVRRLLAGSQDPHRLRDRHRRVGPRRRPVDAAGLRTPAVESILVRSADRCDDRRRGRALAARLDAPPEVARACTARATRPRSRPRGGRTALVAGRAARRPRRRRRTTSRRSSARSPPSGARHAGVTLHEAGGGTIEQGVRRHRSSRTSSAPS